MTGLSGFHLDLIIIGALIVAGLIFRLWQIGPHIRSWLDRALAPTPSDDQCGYIPVPVEDWPESALQRLQRDVLDLTEDEAEDRFAAAAEAIEREANIARHHRTRPPLHVVQEREVTARLYQFPRQVQRTSIAPPVDPEGPAAA